MILLKNIVLIRLKLKEYQSPPKVKDIKILLISEFKDNEKNKDNVRKKGKDKKKDKDKDKKRNKNRDK
jgi:hypothetical protein